MVARYHSRNFFLVVFEYRLVNYPSPVRKGTVAKGSHDAVRLRRVKPVRNKLLSLHGFQNYKNSNKFVQKTIISG